MNIDEINITNRNYMRGTIHHDYEMKWEDDTLMETLLGQLSSIRPTAHDDTVRNEIKHLDSILKSYNYEKTDSSKFLKEVEDAINRIEDKQPRWYGHSFQTISYFVSMQKFCLISGHGGIGKSYFIYRFEEQMQTNAISHLCLYGKCQKTLDNIDFNELRSTAENNLFVFVVDAINELDLSCQDNLIRELQAMSNCRGLRIVVTYRTHNLSKGILASLEDMASCRYTFPGVSYESALDVILRMPVLNVYKYEDILYTNNALYLNMLCGVLSGPQVADEEVNSISSLTYILETYIKRSIGIVHWKNTKTITEWMYNNGESRIPRSILTTLIGPANDDYIFKMKQYGLLDEYQQDDDVFYSFAIQTLTDFLLARYFIQEIQGKSEYDQLKIITNRRKIFWGMDEAFVLALFDLTDDYDLIKRLLKKTDLIGSLDFQVLSHINFNTEQIKSFQTSFHINDPSLLILYLGGYSNKPFNCVNFLNSYYIEDLTRQQTELSRVLSGEYFPGRLIERLKNMIYFVSVTDTEISEEMLWFSLWCTASAHQKARCYALKLLYEIIRKAPHYIDTVIAQWNNILDPYIQEAIIQVFSLQAHNNCHGIQGFLRSCMENRDFCQARSIKRIAISQGTPYKYINADKTNYYHPSSYKEIPKELSRLFLHLDLAEKYLLPFRYWSEDHIDGISSFLIASKQDVKLWNERLEQTYSCVKNGICQGTFSFQNRIFEKYKPSFSLETLDAASLLLSLGRCIEDIMKAYEIDVYRQKMPHGRAFLNSVYRKVIDISVDRFYGSLMCNYYTNSFASYNNIQNSIGYEVYDPIPYDEAIYLASPAPTFESSIEHMADQLVSFINPLPQYDEAWSKNAELSIANLKRLLQPINYKKHQWILLNARIHLDGQGRIETYDLHCCTDPSVHLTGRHDDRFLTIELSQYAASIDQYHHCNDTPWLCKDVPSIKGDKDWFDTTDLVFPPAQMIKTFNLHYELSSMSWNTEDGEIVIRCDNNKSSYFDRKVNGAVFMRKDFYDLFIADTPIHFFCFTEKMLEGKGYTDEASLHIEFKNGELVAQFYNIDEQGLWESATNPLCNDCPFGHATEEEAQRQEALIDFEELLKKLSYKYGIDDVPAITSDNLFTE